MNYLEELINDVKNKKWTEKEWKDLVCNLITIIPENKIGRIDYLINRDELKEDLSKKEIENILITLEKNAEEGMYCDEYYYDYSQDMDVVEGDESWINEINRALRSVKNLFDKKQYRDVIDLYNDIFYITERNNEDFYTSLPNYYYIEDELECNINDHYFNYLEAIYYVESEDKVKEFVDAIKIHDFYLERDNIINDFCEKHKDFRENMILEIVDNLSKTPYEMNKIIFELLMEKGGTDEVCNFLKKYDIEENKRVFEHFCAHIAVEEKYDKLLDYLFELEKVDMKNESKEIVFNEIIEISKTKNDKNLEIEYLYKVNKIHPKLSYTLEICKNLKNEEKVKEMENLEKNYVPEIDEFGKEELEEKILIELILGKVEDVYEIYEKMSNYRKNEFEDLIIYYFLKFGNKDIKEKKLLTDNLKTEIARKFFYDKIDAEETLKIMEYTKKELPREFMEKIEKKFSRKITTETKKYLGSQKRGYYSDVANYLIILVEHMCQEGRNSKGMELFKKYKEQYSNFRAYKNCLNDSIEKSSLNGKVEKI